MKRTLLYFGSFNPPHKGHTAIARYVVEVGLCDEFWIVVSPQNPLKDNRDIVEGEHRAVMLELALGAEGLSSKVKICRVEFSMPIPSYTVDTLKRLEEDYPQMEFSLLIGGDNQSSFERWKSWDYIVENYDIYVYPRPGSSCEATYSRLKVLENVPLMDINSTEIRQCLVTGVENKHKWIHKEVLDYIKREGLWRVKRT